MCVEQVAEDHHQVLCVILRTVRRVTMVTARQPTALKGFPEIATGPTLGFRGLYFLPSRSDQGTFSHPSATSPSQRVLFSARKPACPQVKTAVASVRGWKGTRLVCAKASCLSQGHLTGCGRAHLCGGLFLRAPVSNGGRQVLWETSPCVWAAPVRLITTTHND